MPEFLKINLKPSNVGVPTGHSTRPSWAIRVLPSDREDIRTCHMGIMEAKATMAQIA